MTDVHHHVGHSPLQNLFDGMVSRFPLEYMRLMCLGVARRLLLRLVEVLSAKASGWVCESLVRFLKDLKHVSIFFHVSFHGHVGLLVKLKCRRQQNSDSSCCTVAL